jgi:hypothetical protein
MWASKFVLSVNDDAYIYNTFKYVHACGTLSLILIQT